MDILRLTGARWIFRLIWSKPGDVVGVREKSRELVPFRKALETAGNRTIPEWLSLHEDGLTATIVSLPSREQIDVPVQEHMVVELYSR